MLIRRASSKDYEMIHSLVDNLIRARLISDERSHKYPPITHAVLDNDLYVIAIDDGMAVGLVHGSLYDTHHHRLKQLGYIEELFVREWYRGRWLAKDLFLQLEDEFKKINRTTYSL